MKKFSNIAWGVVFVAVGVLLALRAFEIVDFSIFFRGWWTLFIIVPCFIGLISGREIWGNIIGIGIGVVLLLSARGIWSWRIVGKLIVPFIIVLIGLKMIFGRTFNRKINSLPERTVKGDEKFQEYCATFSGQKVNFNGQNFKGAKLTAVFGGVECDLRGAVIENDAVIEVSAVFGGVDIIVPDNVNVKVYSNSIFGGVDNKKRAPYIEGAPTIHINASCMFGGADVK